MAHNTAESTRVLFIDEPRLADAQAVRDTVKDTGLAFQTAEGVFHAVKSLEDSTFDCVIIPIPRTDVSPSDFVELIREFDPALPIVLVGEPDDASSIFRSLGTPGITIVDDPTDVTRVRSTINRVIAQRHVEQERRRQASLQHSILTLLNEALEAADRTEIERLVYNHWLDSDLYTFAWFGEYDAESATLVLQSPFSGEFSAGEIDSLGHPGDSGLLERAVTNLEVVASRGSSEFRGGATTIDTQTDQGAVAGPEEQQAGGGHSVVVVPVGHEGSTDHVLILLTETAIDTAEQKLLGQMGRAVGKILAVTEQTLAAEDTDLDRIHGFVNLFSHEIRNPLSLALTRLGAAMEEDESPELENVRSHLQEIESILGTFRTVIRPEGVTDPDLRDIGETASEAWRGIDHPDAELFITDSRPVLADHDLLERLFSNLFRNAIQYGGPDVTIRIGVLDDGFYVEDDGPGIRRSERQRVFEWGYSTDEHGMGIGLSFVREITQAHGWTISVTDSDLGGARFEFTGIDWETMSNTAVDERSQTDA